MLQIRWLSYFKVTFTNKIYLENTLTKIMWKKCLKVVYNKKKPACQRKLSDAFVWTYPNSLLQEKNVKKI